MRSTIQSPIKNNPLRELVAMQKSFTFVLLLAAFAQGLWAFTVTGSLTYTKRVYTANNGFGTPTTAPLSKTKVLASNGTSIFTDAYGNFSIDLPDGGTYSLSARSENALFLVSTMNSSTPYSVFVGSGISNGANTITRNIAESEKSGAFNILIQLQRGVDWFAERGYNLTSTMKVYWPGDGSYFDPASREMAFLGSSQDPDEFDDAVILHEFGHYSMDAISKDHSEGGPHSITDNNLDLRLAWSEGLATWISCAIRDNDEYIDSNGSGTTNYRITGALSNSSARTSANEWAVSYLIWKASKNVGSFDDTVRVLASFKGLSEQISLDTFYDQWASLIRTEASFSNYVNEVGMSYKLDSDEPSASTSAYDLGTISGISTRSNLTFFAQNDEDIYQFTPIANASYTIKTANAKNGALTKLDIYKGSLSNLIGSNSQATGSYTDKISSIGIITTDSTPIFVKATRFNSTSHYYGYDSAYKSTVGKYGSYDLSISATGIIIPPPSVTITPSLPDKTLQEFISQSLVVTSYSPAERVSSIENILDASTTTKREVISGNTTTVVQTLTEGGNLTLGNGPSTVVMANIPPGANAIISRLSVPSDIGVSPLVPLGSSVYIVTAKESNGSAITTPITIKVPKLNTTHDIATLVKISGSTLENQPVTVASDGNFWIASFVPASGYAFTSSTSATPPVTLNVTIQPNVTDNDVRLTATVSGAQGVLSYSWSQVDGIVVSMKNANSQTTSFTATSTGSMTFKVDVSDGTNAGSKTHVYTHTAPIILSDSSIPDTTTGSSVSSSGGGGGGCLLR